MRTPRHGVNHIYRKVDHTGSVLCVCVTILVLIWLFKSAWQYDQGAKVEKLTYSLMQAKGALESEKRSLFLKQEATLSLKRAYDSALLNSDPRAAEIKLRLTSRAAAYRAQYEGRYLPLVNRVNKLIEMKNK